MHEIKQAVNYMGPELLWRNAPPPPASNFVHFYYKEDMMYSCLDNNDDITIPLNTLHSFPLAPKILRGQYSR